ncbi:MAG: phage major capsid protein [Iamia sp.]
MSTTTTTAASLIPEDVARLLIQPLEAASVVLAAGPQIFDTSRPLSVPRLTGSTSPAFVAEGALIPEVDVTFDDVTLMPTSRKSIKSISKITEESLRASVVALDAAVQARLVQDQAAVLDQALLTGDGALDTITGITNQPGIFVSAGANLADQDTYLDAVGTWLAAEVDPSRGRWLVHPLDWIALAKVEDTTGRKIVQPDPTLAGRRTIDGIPVVITSRTPAGTVLLVDFGQVGIARDIAPTVQVLTELFAATGHVGIKVTSRWDLGLLHPQGVVKITAPVVP